jgi:hypothetical protein
VPDGPTTRKSPAQAWGNAGKKGRRTLALARNRYRVFKERTYDALVSLKQIFHYHFIDGQASIPEVQANIVRELEYQCSLELDPRTFDRLRQLCQQRNVAAKQYIGR